MIRRPATVLSLVLGLMWLAGPALAQVSVEEALIELNRARELVDESVSLYRQGRHEQAYRAARNAYLDHFELVEIPLRVRDEALTLALEEDFALLRGLIESGAEEAQVRARAGAVQDGLDEVERALDQPGLGAPALAAGYSFTILFREGLEAVLVVAAILGYLEASRNLAYRVPILWGVGLAGLATLLTFVVATLIFRLAPVQREMLEAGTAILAVAVLFYVSFWLVARLDRRRWMEFVRARVWAAASTGSGLALAGVGFTAVYREGLETVLFYQALLSFAGGLEGWVAAGALLAALVLTGIGLLVFRAGRRIPIRTFLTVAVVIVMGLSVALIGNAVRELQQLALLPVTFLEEVPRLPIFLADLTGWHPTRESLLAQAGLAAMYLGGAVWMFGVLPRKEQAALGAARDA